VDGTGVTSIWDGSGKERKGNELNILSGGGKKHKENIFLTTGWFRVTLRSGEKERRRHEKKSEGKGGGGTRKRNMEKSTNFQYREGALGRLRQRDKPREKSVQITIKRGVTIQGVPARRSDHIELKGQLWLP